MVRVYKHSLHGDSGGEVAMDYIDAVRRAQILCETMQDDVGIYDVHGDLHIEMADMVDIAPLEIFRYVKQKIVKPQLMDLD